MNDKTARQRPRTAQWQDWVTLVIGVWLFVAPWLLYGTMTAEAADWNSWVLGAALVVLALAAIFRFQEWEEWVNGVLGLWLIISPWALGFTDLVPAMWNAVICGVIVVAMAAAELWEVRQLRHTQA